MGVTLKHCNKPPTRAYWKSEKPTSLYVDVTVGSKVYDHGLERDWDDVSDGSMLRADIRVHRITCLVDGVPSYVSKNTQEIDYELKDTL
ncbi:hypothetical protein VNI00_010696 [Paramarasmius palmivorus]|uniref:Uncharacterized protein n=1 Tax=Paramarasmius palmivorus TaxID=297713 RepID=A0AAW0CH38_9AGAR